MSEIYWSHFGLPYPGGLIDYVTPSFLGLRVVFLRAAYDNATLRDPSTWNISYIGIGTAVTPSVTTVNPEPGGSPTYVDLVCTDLTRGEDYQLSVLSGTIEDALRVTTFTTNLSVNYVGVSPQPDIQSLTAPSNISVQVTFTKEMDQTTEYLDPDSYIFDNGLVALSVAVESSISVLLTTSSQEDVTYTLTVPLSFQDIALNTIDDNTATFEGNAIVPPVAEELSRISNRLQTPDRDKLAGWNDILQPEPEQILPLVLAEEPDDAGPNTAERLGSTRSLAVRILKKIDELNQKIDQKCSKFKVSSDQGVGSPLFQAMVRVFNERTTTVTYDHYKRALEYRQQLAKEDAETLRLQ